MEIMRQRSQIAAKPGLVYGLLTDILPVISGKRRERFESKISRSLGCWLWQGTKLPSGYGLIQGSIDRQGYSFLAHRVAWALDREMEPGGEVIRHSCDNPSCCNPQHLTSGTHADNHRDMVERGRLGTAAGQKWVHVKHRGKPEQAWELRYSARWPLQRIADHLGCHRQTVMRWLRQP